MSNGGTTLEFHSGVVRFDAMGNLFVHLTHGSDDPHPFSIGDDEHTAPAKDRRARLLGDGDATVTGKFPTVTDLPRGLVIDVRGYDSVTLGEDGAMVIVIADATEVPDWLTRGEHHLFRRDGELVRMWAKSSVPDGAEIDPDAAPNEPKKGRRGGARSTISYADKEKPAPKATAKKSAKAKDDDKSKSGGKKKATRAKDDDDKKKSGGKKKVAKAKDEKPAKAKAKAEKPAPEPAPEPPEAKPEPYHPPRMPAGSYTAGRRAEEAAKKGLGCGVLALLPLIAVAVAIVL